MKKLPKPITRQVLVARLDAAVERSIRRRVELRLAERTMRAAREALERFDAEATRVAPPVHGR